MVIKLLMKLIRCFCIHRCRILTGAADFYSFFFIWFVSEEEEETEGKEKKGRKKGVVFEMSRVGKGRRQWRGVIVIWILRDRWI